MKNKLIKILKRIFVTLVIIFAAAFITNEIIYQISIPDEFENANWSGTWNSSEYKLVSGRVLTSIPTPIVENSEFKSPTFLYYNIWSLYKPGQSKVVEMNGLFGRDNFKVNSELDNKNLDDLEPFTSNYFKAKISFDNCQLIEYTGLKWKDNELIFGDYISKYPSDSGDFELISE